MRTPSESIFIPDDEFFEGELFDPVVFDNSAKEFRRVKEKLADYFSEELGDMLNEAYQK